MPYQQPVTIIMVEDDEGHARLIERNIRRSGVNNEIKPFTSGTAALNYLFGKDGSGHSERGLRMMKVSEAFGGIGSEATSAVPVFE